jgi:hypothetical protein
MADITYVNKDKDIKDGTRNKWKDADANEVKTAVNSKADRTEVAALATPFRGDHNVVVAAFLWPTANGTFTGGKPGQGNVYDIVLDDPASPPTVGGKLITHGSTIRAKINDPSIGGTLDINAQAVNWIVSNA